MITIPLADEQLSDEEVTSITGTTLRARQLVWLRDNGWPHYVSQGGRPVVGRLAARLILCGIDPRSLSPTSPWVMDLAKVR
ncbi:MAG: DUF4224 domain-containing protein [Corallincola sp.]|nr:DUF4224 domain-containing protein [Corallincola sp.]